MKDLTKQTNDSVTAAEFTQPMTELKNVIQGMGIALSENELDQLHSAIVGLAGSSQYYLDVGSADIVILNQTGSRMPMRAQNASHDGYLLRFRPNATNTGASTINVVNLGTLSLVREDGSALSSGDLLTTRDAVARYDHGGTRWMLQTFSIPAGALTVPRGYLDGYQLVNNGTWGIDFGAGITRNSTSVETIELAAVLRKNINATWVAGDNVGGLPSALTLLGSTWYHCFVIKDTSGNVDAGYDTSLTAVNLLSDSGFTYFRRVGSVRTNIGPTRIQSFFQRGDEFVWEGSHNDVSISSPGTASVSHTLPNIPLGINVDAHANVTFGRPDVNTVTHYRVGTGAHGLLSGASSSDHDAVTDDDSRYAHVNVKLLSGVAQEIWTRQDDSNANATIQIQVHGYTDRRGRE